MGYEIRHSKGQINYPAVLLGRLGVDVLFSGFKLGRQMNFYEECGLKLIFGSEEQERIYRQIEDDKPLETKLLYRDLILLRRRSIRQ